MFSLKILPKHLFWKAIQVDILNCYAAASSLPEIHGVWVCWRPWKVFSPSSKSNSKITRLCGHTATCLCVQGLVEKFLTVFCSSACLIQSTVSFNISFSRTSSKGSAEHGVSRSHIKTPQPWEQNCCPAGLANRAETCCRKLRKVLFPVHSITDFTFVLRPAAAPAMFSTVSLVHACNVPTQIDELL